MCSGFPALLGANTAANPSSSSGSDATAGRFPKFLTLQPAPQSVYPPLLMI